MMSSYGATARSQASISLERTDSIERQVFEDDDEYDYLPLPEVDEDYVDQADSVPSSREVHRRRPFSAIHDPPLPFDSHSRACFLVGQKIIVEIVRVERHSEHSQVLNPNLYVIQCSHGDYKWTLRRRYKHFRSLHDSLLLFRTRALLPVVTKEARDRRKTFVKTNQGIQKFPKRPEALVRMEHLEIRKKQLEAYLQSILKCSQYRNHPETLKFLGVSRLSFISGLGSKLKEEMVEKRAGGRRIALSCCTCCFYCQPGHWQQRWMVVKDSFVAYIRPNDGTIRDVLLMDKDFSVKCGLLATGVRHGVRISNMSRHLLLKAYTERKANEWHDEIKMAIETTGRDYTEKNRYDSFVPVRSNSYTNWFVDGASYMAAVADALEAAKEEIFITDWMLSPELYLKRPNLEGDRWRLDVILKRKAEVGVKVFILVYKELEMALGINSYYTKHTLTSLHSTNIKVMRHPDGIKLWSHHEKIVVVDQRVAFLGGIDLCYGRWDTRKHRLTDMGSVSLSNIYGNQDDETLENVLHNVSNIVPQMHVVNANKHAGFGESIVTPVLENIREVDSESQFDIHGSRSDVGLDKADEYRSYDTVDTTSADNNLHQNRVSESKSVVRLVERDTLGGYSNPNILPSPTDNEKRFDPSATVSKHSSEETSHVISSVAPCSDLKGYLNMGATTDSPVHVKFKSNVTEGLRDSNIDTSKGVYDEIHKSDIVVVINDISNPSQKNELSVNNNRPSGFTSALRGALIAGGVQSEPAETATSPPRHLVHQKASICEDSASLTSYNVDDEDVADNGQNLDANRFVESTESLQPTTLQIFLKNVVDKRNEITENLNRANRDVLHDTAMQPSDVPDTPPIEVTNHVTSSTQPGEQSQSNVKKKWRSVVFNNPHAPHRSTSSSAGDKQQHNESAETVSASEAHNMLMDEIREHQLSRVINASNNSAKRSHYEPRPSTPKGRRRAPNNAFRAAVARMMFMRQRSESIDVTDDNSSRPWDESVYNAKEDDQKDTDLDAQLATSAMGSSLKIWVGKDYVNFCFKDFIELDRPFTDMVDRTVTPRMPWHDIGAAVFGKPARDIARHFVQRWNFTKLQKKKTTDDVPMLLPKSNTSVSVPNWVTGSAFCCNCQILRSACEWSAGIKTSEASIYNAYIDLIMDAKHYIYIENQFFISIHGDRVVENGIATALYERIVQAHNNGETFRVYVIMPLLPAFEGHLGTSTGTSIQAVIHWNYQSICRGGNSLLERLVKKVNDPFKYISFYGLRKHEEMLGNLTTELVYVHSKLMIVDDQSVIIGSANINDRSLIGYRDSEIAIIVQDTNPVISHMNGHQYKAGTFACSLRKSLFREHLGIKKGDASIDVSDPVCEHFYKNVWLKQASVNTSTYDKVFNCIPTDAVLSLQQLLDYEKQPKLALINPTKSRKLLQKVRGHLVLLPLQFLSNENLLPAAGTRESLAPTVIWT